MHVPYAIRASCKIKGLLKQFHDVSPKKGGQQSNKDNFFNDSPRLAGGLPRHEAPTPEMCTAAPAAFQVTTLSKWVDEGAENW